MLRANIIKALVDDNGGPVAELDARIADLWQNILNFTRCKEDYDDLGNEALRLAKKRWLEMEEPTRRNFRRKIPRGGYLHGNRLRSDGT